MSNQFLVYFDCIGFEEIHNITDVQEQAMMAKIKGEPLPELGFNWLAMRMRAIMNNHRRPEIWLIDTEDTITLDIITGMAHDCPQQLADLVRARGQCLFKSGVVKDVIR